MMWLYNIVMAAYETTIKFVAFWHPKARLWSDGRKRLEERLRADIAKGERIVWVHAASLGEFEQGRPIIERIRTEHPEYKIGKVNVDEQPELASSFGVMSIPSIFVLEGGKVIKKALGARSKTELLSMLE